MSKFIVPPADLRGCGGIQVELQEPLVCADRHRRLLERVRRLSQREQRLLVRPNFDDQLVGRDRLGGRGLVLHRRLLQLRARLAGEGSHDRVLAESLTELVGGGGSKRGADACVLLRKGRELSLAEEAVGLPELELAQTPESRDVLRPQLRVLRPGGDRLIDAALALQRGCELLAANRVERALIDSLLRLRDGSPGTALVTERIADELPEVEPAGAHAEEYETAPEDEDENDERPLRLIAQAGKEHRVLGYARGATTGFAAGWASMARLALCAAAVSSCQSIPPFS